MNKKKAFRCILALFVLLMFMPTTITGADVSGKTFSWENNSQTTVLAQAQIRAIVELTIGDPYMYVNLVKQEIDPGRGTTSVIVNNRTLLPIRAVIEAIGGIVTWNEVEKKVTVMVDGIVVEILMTNPVYEEAPVFMGVDVPYENKGFYKGSKIMKVDGQTVVSDVAPMIMNDRMFLPFRFVAESVGSVVEWEGKTRKVILVHYETSISVPTNSSVPTSEPFPSQGATATPNPTTTQEPTVTTGPTTTPETTVTQTPSPTPEPTNTPTPEPTNTPTPEPTNTPTPEPTIDPNLGVERIVEEAPSELKSFIVSDTFGGAWQDVEKSPNEDIDDIWCYIAGPCNILAWSGWGKVHDDTTGADLESTDDIWENYKAYWKRENDGAEDCYDVLQWFFDGKPDDEPNVPEDGGNYHPDLSMPSYGNETLGDFYVGFGGSDLEEDRTIVTQFMREGYAFSVQMKGVESGRHVITLWGYSYDDNDEIKGFYFTNSDDDKKNENPPDRLYYREAYFDEDENDWVIKDENGEDDYYLTFYYGLKARNESE